MKDFLKQDIKPLLWSTNRMEPGEMFSVVIAVEAEVQLTITDLLSRFCLNHPDNGGRKSPNEALPCIMKKLKHLDSISCLAQQYNRNKFFVSNGDELVKGVSELTIREDIDILNLDSITLHSLLNSIKGFPTYRSKLNKRRVLLTCKNPLHQQCCLACNHKCRECGKKECKDETACHDGERCNHECHNCKEIKYVCLHSSSVCCKKCKMCTYCGLKLILNKNDQCDRLKLVLALDDLFKFSQMLPSLTKSDCKNFLDGAVALPGFPLMNKWEEICEILTHGYNSVLEYMVIQENFRKCDVMTHEMVGEKKEILACILQDNVDKSLLKHRHRIRKIFDFFTNSQKELEDFECLIAHIAKLEVEAPVKSSENDSRESDEADKAVEQPGDPKRSDLLASESDGQEIQLKDEADGFEDEGNIFTHDAATSDESNAKSYRDRVQSINPFETSSTSSLELSDNENEIRPTDRVCCSQENIENEPVVLEPNPSTLPMNDQMINKINEIENHMKRNLDELNQSKEQNMDLHTLLKHSLKQNHEELQANQSRIEETITMQLSVLMEKFELLQNTIKSSYQELKSDIEDIKEKQTVITHALNNNVHQPDLKADKKNGFFSNRLKSDSK